MRMRTLHVLAFGLVPILAGTVLAAPLDLKRYMPFSQIKVGMTGVGKTTLESTSIIEFQVTVLATLKNVGPKRDLIICRCRGAGLEESGVIAGMSGSPVFIDGRLIGAVAYAYQWCKLPIAGIQPIEQMLSVTDEFPWVGQAPRLASGSRGAAASERLMVPAAAMGPFDMPAAAAGAEGLEMQPIGTPVMVSGVSTRTLARLRDEFAPFGMVPMQGGAAEQDLPVAARLEPGAPLAISLVRGDIEMSTMGTITEIVGDRLYGFGHAMFGSGETNLPLMTGVAKVVIPSQMRSSRMGAPAKEVGRLVWDEETGVFGRLAGDRAPMVPMTVKVTGPAKGRERLYRCEMAHHRAMTSMFSGMVAGGSLTAHNELPIDHTVAYRVSVKPAGREPIVRENLTVSPDGDAYVAAVVRGIVRMVMDNPFQNLTLESVEVQATIEPVSRMAEIEEIRPLRNAVRPGGTVPVELKIRPWRAEPQWIKVDVKVPDDHPQGKCVVTLCGADEAQRQEMREAPIRFQPDDLGSMLAHLARDERRDQLFVRIQAPGEGLAIGRQELPNLPASRRTVLADSARRRVTGVTGAVVTRKAMPFVLRGAAQFEVAVDDRAPEP